MFFKKSYLFILIFLGVILGEESCFNLKLPKKSLDFSLMTFFWEENLLNLGVGVVFNKIVAVNKYAFLEFNLGLEAGNFDFVLVPYGTVVNFGSRDFKIIFGVNGRMVAGMTSERGFVRGYTYPISPIFGFRENLSDKLTLKMYGNFFIIGDERTIPIIIHLGINYRF